MTKLSIAVGIGCLMAAPVLADGDPAAGEKAFRQCQTCHVVADAGGNVLAGKNAKTGPNLFGVVGRTAGTEPDFAYGPDLVKAGKTPDIGQIRTKVGSDPQNALPDPTVKNVRLPDEPDGMRFVIDSSLEDRTEMEKRLVALFPDLLDHNTAAIESLPLDKPLEADVAGPRRVQLL